ncbi:LPS-assembly lipoprotein LptE [Kushneria aurantia]|uniref:LPS-assembly lipoprotein LptE n=1 Tax=Kushneria aurantia TaxID=504092 RepID=A0ABV6G452_9GAMM|nr:LPS assembly lipoprotein LptE [Kushneria aurantia]
MERRTFLFGLAGSAGALLLSGCGFHLRGTGGGHQLPFSRLALNAADGPTNPLTRQVQQALNSAGVVVEDSAPWRLNMGPESFDERELTYGDAGIQERQMTLTLPWSLQRRDDNAYLVSQESLSLSGTFYTSSDQLLTRDDARNQLRRELRQQAARRLIDRLQNLDPGDAS